MNRLLVLAVLVVAQSAWAQYLLIPDMESARSVGMGGAYRGTGLGADSVMGNPAALAMQKAFQIELQGAYDFPHKEGFGGVALRDSQTSDVAAGVSYDYLALGRNSTRSYGSLATAAVAVPLADFINIGVSGRYLNEYGYHHANAASFDGGAIVKIGGSFSLGAAAHNLIDTKQPLLSRYFSGSLAFVAPSFSVAADLRSTLNRTSGKPLLNVGGEYLIGQVFFLRAGFIHDFENPHNFVSGGVGVTFQGGGLDVAYRHEFGGDLTRLLAATIHLSM